MFECLNFPITNSLSNSARSWCVNVTRRLCCVFEQKGNSDSSLQAQSTGDDSSSDTQMSEHDREPVTPKTEPSDYPMLDDHNPFSTNGGLMDPSRTPTFPGALLNLPGTIFIVDMRGFIVPSSSFPLFYGVLKYFYHPSRKH